MSSIYSENLFKEAGEVVDVRFATNKDDGSFRGFGHVEFSTSEDAQKVCASVFAYGERSIVLKLSC